MSDSIFQSVRQAFDDDKTFAVGLLKVMGLKAHIDAKHSESKNRKGFVYFMTDGNLVKIGRTKNNPIERLKALKVGNANISMIGHVPTQNAELLEKTLHEELSKFHVSGEWFSISTQKAKRIIKKNLKIFKDLLTA